MKHFAVTKYRNKRTAGYSSKREAARAQELKLLEKAGKISNLREQVKYELIPKQEGERACYYIADFEYLEHQVGDGWEGDVLVTEDSKGFRNRVYLLKRKLFQHKYGRRIRET